MSIAVRQVSKRFGSFAALDDVLAAIAGGSLTALLGAERRREVDASTRDRRARDARRRRGLDPRRRRHRVQLQQRGVGFVFQHYAPFKHMTARENVAFRAHDPQAAEGGDPRAGGRAPPRSSSLDGSPTAT